MRVREIAVEVELSLKDFLQKIKNESYASRCLKNLLQISRLRVQHHRVTSLLFRTWYE